MESWPAQLVILLMYAGLMVFLVRHASREWEKPRNRYLVGFLIAGGVFFGSSSCSAARSSTWWIGRRDSS